MINILFVVKDKNSIFYNRKMKFDSIEEARTKK